MSPDLPGPQPRSRALVVGAGIGGLAAGVALRRAGWDVRIFERASSPRELGFALSLAPNAVAALRELGLADRVVARGCVGGATELRKADGAVLKRFDLGSALSGEPSVVALRQALHGALLEATDPAGLSLDSEAIGFRVSDGGVVLTLAGGRSETGDILVGADGVRSVIRAQLHPGEPPPRRSGYTAIRGAAHGVLYHLGNATGVAYLGRAVEAATIRAGGDVIYWYMSLLSGDVPPVTEGVRATAERCAAMLDRSFRAIVRATRTEDLRIDELLDRKPIAQWGSGPVTLLGDAAHPMLPHTGQGAAQALEDAVALGLALSAGDAPEAGLRRYELIRSGRTRALVYRGRRIAAFTTNKSRVVDVVRSLVIRLVPARAMASGFLLAGDEDPHRPLRLPPAP
jgi:2-polyprenyl-6-methoxyphenol hydroxylase-like FAD-dependent oxidoreductase